MLLEDVPREFGQVGVVGAHVEAPQFVREPDSLQVEVVQIPQILLGVGAIGQLGNRVLLQPQVIDVQDKLGHHLLRVVEHLLHEFVVVGAHGYDVLKHILAAERAHLTLLDECVDALRVALEVRQNGGQLAHTGNVLAVVRSHKLVNQISLDLVVLGVDLLLGVLEFVGWQLLGNQLELLNNVRCLVQLLTTKID